MMMALWILPILYLGIQCWQLSVLLRYKSQSTTEFPWDELPYVSIWVACRNEEHTISGCLDALLQLDYPKEKIQILVGNDQSTDNTRDIILSYTQAHPHIRLIDIQEDESGLKAKARVMAQLDALAEGSYYLITDADVRVKPNWIQGLLSNINPQIGVASGTTMVRSTGMDGWLQEIDWAYFMGLLNIISYSGVPATAVGNNMIIREDAYWQTGGYSQIRFSITEDYKLYREICKKGWQWNNIMNSDTLSFSEKTTGFLNLLHQRKRWLSGGKELPWYWWVLFGVYGGFYFMIPPSLFYFTWEARVTPAVAVITIWFLKWVIQSLQIRKIYTYLGEKPPGMKRLLFYELYLSLVTILTALFFITPLKTKWKGRKYAV